jgi:hypothetical protein
MGRAGRPGNRVGKLGERLAGYALQQLKEEGKIKSFLFINGKGKDYQVVLNDSRTLSLEIKSSYEGRRRHQRKYQTPVIIIRNTKQKLPTEEQSRLVKIAKIEILKLFLRNSQPD